MVLIDTSLWVSSLRHTGRADDRTKLSALIQNREACWCAAVRLELWAGIGDAREREAMKRFLAVVIDLPMTAATWDLAIATAENGRRHGRTFPFADLLIFACARIHRAELLHRDQHFDQMAKLR